MFGDFDAKLGREGIFESIPGNETLHEDSNGSGVKVAKCNAQPIWVKFVWHFSLWSDSLNKNVTDIINIWNADIWQNVYLSTILYIMVRTITWMIYMTKTVYATVLFIAAILWDCDEWCCISDRQQLCQQNIYSYSKWLPACTQGARLEGKYLEILLNLEHYIQNHPIITKFCWFKCTVTEHIYIFHACSSIFSMKCTLICWQLFQSQRCTKTTKAATCE